MLQKCNINEILNLPKKLEFEFINGYNTNIGI